MPQLHNSYSTLGRDIKTIFDDLATHLSTQQAEANELRRQLAVSHAAAIKSEEEMSSRFDKYLVDERRQGAADRASLISQITDLVTSTSTTQEQRIGARITEARKDMAMTRVELATANTSFSTSMDAWSQKEAHAIDEIVKHRETLKVKLKQDWASIDEHNKKIQSTTRSVQEETVRIVDSQVQDMASQMQALDDFVARAKTENESVHLAQVNTLQGLGATFNGALAEGKEYKTEICNRLQTYRDEMLHQTVLLDEATSPLDETIGQPLANLRETVLEQPLTDYAPTGETPQKVHYIYPSTLSRTIPHAQLLAASRSKAVNSLPDLLETPLSPSKSIVYNDLVHDPVGLRPTSADDILNASSLREVAVNVNAVGVARNGELVLPTKPDSENFSSSLMNLSTSLMGPPTKKFAADAKLSHKGIRANVSVKGEKENVAPARTRRLRSSVTQT